MKCSHCQHEWTSPPEECPNCHAHVDAALRVRRTSHRPSIFSLFPSRRRDRNPPDLRGVKWGAMLLSVFWAGGMGLWTWCGIILVVILVGLVPGITLYALIALLAICLYLGFKGRTLAWYSLGRKWANAPHSRVRSAYGGAGASSSGSSPAWAGR